MRKLILPVPLGNNGNGPRGGEGGGRVEQSPRASPVRARGREREGHLLSISGRGWNSNGKEGGKAVRRTERRKVRARLEADPPHRR